MNNKPKILYVLCIVLIANLCFMTYQYILKNRDIKHVNEITKLKDAELRKQILENNREKATFKATLLTAGTLLSLQDSVIVKLKKDNKELKDIVAYTQIQTVTKGEIKEIVLNDTIYKEIPVKAFKWSDNWLQVSGITDYNTIDLSYELKNELSLTYTWQRDKWYKAKYLQGSIINENPNTTVNRVIEFKVKPENKFYEKWWFNFGVGVLTGVAVNNFIK